MGGRIPKSERVSAVTIHQILEGLSQVKEFVRKDQYPPEIERYFVRRRWENLILINYTDAATYEFPADDWTPAMRVCRGIILTDDGSQVVSFPFHKFFNVGESSETKPDEIARWTVRAVTEKIDGVMIQVFRWKGELIWASRHAVWSNAATDAFKAASAAVEKIFPKGNWTLICELVHPAHRKAGMIDYGDLIALGVLYIRNLDTMELIPAREKFDSDLPSPLFLPALYPVSQFWEAKALVSSATTRSFEGVVLQGADELGNRLVKIKNPIYLDAVAAVRQITPNRIISVYERTGLAGVKDLLLLYKDILDDIPEAREVAVELERAEAEFTARCLELRGKDLSEIPQHLRWVKTYEVGSEKWNKAVWRNVAEIVRKRRR
jgi:hypothetical protein